MRILLIEDNDANAAVLTRLLTSAGHEVAVAVTGEDGVLKAESIAPDVIVMDLTLPGIDGLEATRRIKASPRTWTIPVVAFTGLGCEEERIRALQAGCDGFIAKPIAIRDLIAQLESLTAGNDGAAA